MVRRLLRFIAKRAGIQRVPQKGLLFVNGKPITLPVSREITCSLSEPWMPQLLSKILPLQENIFLDVGVNLGQTLITVKALDPDREYVGFEPNPSCFTFPQDIIKENQFDHCLLFPVGLFSETGVLGLDFFSDSPIGSSATLVDQFRPSERVYSRIFVPVFRFDDLGDILGGREVGIIKIDVEGSELDVLKSLLNRVARDRPVIIIEILPVYSEKLTQRKNRQSLVEKLFAEQEYHLYRILKSDEKTYTGLTRIDSIGIHSDLALSDYLAIPAEKTSHLLKEL